MTRTKVTCLWPLYKMTQTLKSKLNAYSTTFKLDTGAQCNVISKQTYQQMPPSHLWRAQNESVWQGEHSM